MRWVLWVALSGVAVWGGPLAVNAAGFAIDPDPKSPTLGELLDRDAARTGTIPARLPAQNGAPPPASSQSPALLHRPAASEPIIPQGAVTVLAPGVRQRNGGIKALPKR